MGDAKQGGGSELGTGARESALVLVAERTGKQLFPLRSEGRGERPRKQSGSVEGGKERGEGRMEEDGGRKGRKTQDARRKGQGRARAPAGQAMHTAHPTADAAQRPSAARRAGLTPETASRWHNTGHHRTRRPDCHFETNPLRLISSRLVPRLPVLSRLPHWSAHLRAPADAGHTQQMLLSVRLRASEFLRRSNSCVQSSEEGAGIAWAPRSSRSGRGVEWASSLREAGREAGPCRGQ